MKKSQVILGVVGGLFIATGAQALTDTGSSPIQVFASNIVNITGVDGISVSDTVDDITADVVKDDDVCIWSRSGAYKVTATSATGAFSLDGGKITYTVGWDATQGGTFTGLTYGAASADISATIMNGALCGGATNAAFRVTFDAAGLQAASIGTHTDTLTFTIAGV